MEVPVTENPGPPWSIERNIAPVGNRKDPDTYDTHTQLSPRGAPGALSGGNINPDDRINTEDETASLLNGDSVSANVRHQHITFESARPGGLSPAICLRDSSTAGPRSSSAIVNLADPAPAGSADTEVERLVEGRAEDEGHAEDEEGDEGDEDEDEDEDEGGDEGADEELHARTFEFLPVYRKHDDDLPKYATLHAGPTASIPSQSSPPPSPPKKIRTMPLIPTFYIPTSAEVRALWVDGQPEDTDSAGQQTSSGYSSTSSKRTPAIFSLFRQKTKTSRRKELTIPPLHMRSS
ncbi:hypothetical protein CALCODRAFT_481490 [Calocera cornea HHB12733]|uniref:Uncharacterized protein n=1 Tax=Calocera cornea HHB12733 TaxID=1353952 RepID=A0A165HQE5_9BASI|nr:hypothetical protein CALCODRAFT_481490 [Calocera cornea HHB12733]